MKIKSVVLKGWDHNEGYELLVNGWVVGSTDYDTYGSAGYDLLEEVHRGLARLANVYPAVEDGIEEAEEEDRFARSLLPHNFDGDRTEAVIQRTMQSGNDITALEIAEALREAGLVKSEGAD